MSQPAAGATSTAEANQKLGEMQSAQLEIQRIFDGNRIMDELFTARCNDTNDSANTHNAKQFKEEFTRRNVKLSNGNLNLHSMRLGINSIMALSNCISCKPIERLNLADNSISDYGMHAVKNILNNPEVNLKQLNLASNMISGEGLELFLDDLIQNKHLKHLDMGIMEGSMKKNSLGIQGAVCISALLIKNKVLESLCINDNDLGPDGGECVGIALQENESLKVLKISENDLKSEGAIPIIKSSINLTQLCLAKNFMKSDVGKPLARLLKSTISLQKLSLEFNELSVQGTKWIAKGIAQNQSLESLSIKGNMIGDDGMILLAEALKDAPKLTFLDCSLNEVGPAGFQALCEVL